MAENIVACAIWGDWPGSRMGWDARHQNRGGDPELQSVYIERMANMVARHLTLPHRFIVFADDQSKVPDGIESLPLELDWYSRGLPKAYLYGGVAPEFTDENLLVMDLDAVIVGNIDCFFEHDHDLVAKERFYMLPKIVTDGDIIFSKLGSKKSKKCGQLFHQEMGNRGATTQFGDEREVLGRAGAITWGEVIPGRLVSYKRHCQQWLPQSARIVSFHGKPLPDQVKDEWVKEHWQ